MRHSGRAFFWGVDRQGSRSSSEPRTAKSAPEKEGSAGVELRWLVLAGGVEGQFWPALFGEL